MPPGLTKASYSLQGKGYKLYKFLITNIQGFMEGVVV